MGIFTSIINRSISGNFSSNVLYIRREALRVCTNLTSVSFPNVISIGEYAFFSCSNLTSASFPNVTSIGGSAFSGCSKLTTIYVGTNTSTVCTLGTGAFDDCSNLTNIYVPANLVNSYKSAAKWSDSKIVNKIKAAP